ncbi:glycogen debranching protein [Candidatus Binatus sp.]|uniref:glycogen debranching protein n=1 Tax=Candidatus Binatus sp. TaxID=2811406 RepID=UPI003C8ED171
MVNWSQTEGSPQPLGATWLKEEKSYNFSLYSRHATGVTLLLYTARDLVNPVLRVSLNYLNHKSGRIWHCRLKADEVANASYYAYSVEGPSSALGEVHFFDPDKVLLDPYARSLFFPADFRRSASIGRGSNAGRTPVGTLPVNIPAFDWGGESNPFDWGGESNSRHTSDTIIYEMHVRGFTNRDNSGVSADKRGTFAGVVEKIPYLKELGVTALELMPVFQYDPDEGNYWGYMPLNFFSPHQGYAANLPVAEATADFKAMVKELHRAGIEVILDVVYNHTTEAGADGPTYSYRGICNSTYYLLDESMSHYRNDTGTGNVLRAAHPTVRKMIIDSLRFWVLEMHVDGFRFDLASIFSRNIDGSINLKDPPLISEITGGAEYADVRLIAEAWDPASYELGRSFPGQTWSQWNGRFRDDVRGFVKSDAGKVGDLMTRLYGSSDLFPDDLDDAYHPAQSINYITSHDGFCLYDLVAYNDKHNLANGQNNTDGTDNNLSWNCGWEGDENVPAEVMRLRKQQIKNFFTILMVSNGTPMFCAGDEFMNTQRGNNNPWNQDNETTWLDWDLLQKNSDMFRFFKGMIAFRKAHPSLGRSRFWREDVNWYGVNGQVDLGYLSHSVAFCLHGGSQQERDIYVMINAYWQDLNFKIQEGKAGDWNCVADTAMSSPSDFFEVGKEKALTSLNYEVKARSVVVLVHAA